MHKEIALRRLRLCLLALFVLDERAVERLEFFEPLDHLNAPVALSILCAWEEIDGSFSGVGVAATGTASTQKRRARREGRMHGHLDDGPDGANAHASARWGYWSS